MNKQEAGRLGGLTTYLRHPEQMAAMGHTGGRPKSPTLEDILRQQRLVKLKNKIKEDRVIECVLASNNLSELKRAFKLRYQKSTGENKNNGEVVLAGN